MTPPIVRHQYTVRFLTPAFLDGADQSGEWRTPPFKALLRQWWRVAVAKSHNYDHAAIRKAEGRLFGNAWLDANAEDTCGHCRSQVRIRLSHWSDGTLRQWSKDPAIEHPEVKNREGSVRPVGAQLYLGYGPLTFKQGATALKASAALEAGEEAVLACTWPREHDEVLRQSVWLMDQFGALGGRSRNGWGSLSLTARESTPVLDGDAARFGRDWKSCLDRDWPHAIGLNERMPLVWDFGVANWTDAMTRLGRIKIALRTRFSLAGHANGGELRDRHLLSYPVTKHATNAYDRNARLPNALRFKLVINGGALQARIFHMPCKPPDEVWNRGRAQLAQDQLERLWQQVHDATPGAIAASAQPAHGARSGPSHRVPSGR